MITSQNTINTKNEVDIKDLEISKATIDTTSDQGDFSKAIAFTDEKFEFSSEKPLYKMIDLDKAIEEELNTI